MRTLNLGILAHVDAGKTTLTERFLYAAGAIAAPGRVDDGTTQTDYLALERERGITIRSAVATVALDDVSVNILDTPGHPDFIAEVERALSVLDGAVLVVSAVEGVQSQTPLLWRALQRLGVPTLLFVNKIDRGGAEPARVLAEIRKRLTPRAIPLGTVESPGTGAARFVEGGGNSAFLPELTAALAEHDDGLLNAYLEGERVPTARVMRALRRQTARVEAHPVLFGSAMTGAGVDALTDAIAKLLPSTSGADDADVSAKVFKIEHTPSGARAVYVRVFRGAIAARDHVRYHGPDREDRVTELEVFVPGGAVPEPVVRAGQIARLYGLKHARVGDVIGEPTSMASRAWNEHQFPPPALESVVEPVHRVDAPRLRAALGELAEQDPLIAVRQDGGTGAISVSLYGEVQKEVIEATLVREYGIAAAFRETTMICIERPVGTGVEEQLLRAATHTNISGRSSPNSPNPYQATLGMRIEPASAGSGVEVVLDVDVHLVPLYVYKTVDAFREQLAGYVHDTLETGLFGWHVTDCLVTVWDCGYARTGSTAGDFRKLTELVLRVALERAGTVVCEPMALASIELPVDHLSGFLGILARIGARNQSSRFDDDVATVAAVLPTARLAELRRLLPGATGGQGVLDAEFTGYEPVTGPPPSRPSRTGATRVHGRRAAPQITGSKSR